MAKHDLVVFSVLRNGIANGYPFVEAYGSWLPYCDRIFILDGGSTDGTDTVLAHLAALSPKFTFERGQWPTSKLGGSSIAQFTNTCLEMVRPQAQRLVYIQADEILERPTRQRLAQHRAGAVELMRYILFWNSFHKVIRFESDGQRARSTAWKAIKLFPANADFSSCGDGLTFEIRGATPVDHWQDEVFHYGWNFPVNILQKHSSHANLYSDNPRYLKRAATSARMLLEGKYDLELLDAMDPEYINRCQPFIGFHPACVQHLLSQTCYDPYVGLSLLRQGVQW